MTLDDPQDEMGDESELLLTDEVQDEPEQQEEDGEDDVIVSFGDEPTTGDDLEQDGADLPKRLRRELDTRGRDLAAAKRDKAELERRLAELTAPKVEEVGKEPDLWEDCDGDPERYARELRAYDGRKKAAEDAERRVREAATEQERTRQKMLDGYANQKAKLGRPDFQVMEDAVVAVLSPAQQALIVEGADDPAKLIYALGRSPAKLAALAEIGNLAKFTAAMGRLEEKVKVETRTVRKAPEPERVARGGSSVAAGGGAAKKLAELEARAEKTGDRSEVIRYKRSLKENGK